MSGQSLKISEVIRPDTVDLVFENVKSKEDAIARLIDKLDGAGLLLDKKVFTQSVYEREAMGSTYMENFIAIPHGKSPGVREAGIAFGKSEEGFEYLSAGESGPVKLVFLLAIPDRTSGDDYMAVLAQLARLLIHEEFQESMITAKNYDDVYSAIVNGEKLLIE